MGLPNLADEVAELDLRATLVKAAAERLSLPKHSLEYLGLTGQLQPTSFAKLFSYGQRRPRKFRAEAILVIFSS